MPIRLWIDLDPEEKKTACQELTNRGWIDDSSNEILSTISYLNHKYLRLCPGKMLHNIPPKSSHSHRSDNFYPRAEAALDDFINILINSDSEPIVLVMLSRFAETQISDWQLDRAEKKTDPEERESLINDAYKKFDRLALCMNNIFEQFSVNALLTRTGIIPRQEDKITKEIYEPVLQTLADPKWKSLNDDIGKMFSEYRDGNYPEVITKAHGAVHRFLQVLVGEEGKSGKGEVGKLYSLAIRENKIPVSRFTKSIVDSIQSFIVAERATKSSAKPAKEDATSEDALLNMNVLMVFLQHCLQNGR